MGAELRREPLVVPQEGEELDGTQHAGQGCLWAEALRQYAEQALQPETQARTRDTPIQPVAQPSRWQMQAGLVQRRIQRSGPRAR